MYVYGKYIWCYGRDVLAAKYDIQAQYRAEANFTFSEPCIVIHKRDKDQKDTHFFLIVYFN